MEGAVVLHVVGEGIVGVGVGEVAPELRDLGRVGTPFGTGQALEKRIFVRREVVEGKFARGLVHHARIVAEVPALHDGGNARIFHGGVLAVQETRHRHERHGGHLVRAAHLDLCAERGARLHGGLGHALERHRRTRERQPVVAAEAHASALVLDRAGLEVVEQREAIGNVACRLIDPRCALGQHLRLVEPADDFGLGIDAAHALEHGRHRVQVDLPGLELGTARTAGRKAQDLSMVVPLAGGGKRAEAGGGTLAVADVDESP